MLRKRLFSKSISKIFLLVSAFMLAITFVVENPTRVVSAEAKDTSTTETSFGNDIPVHDPSIIKVEDTYYVFGTHGAAAIS